MPQGETGSLPLVIDLHDSGQDVLTRARTSGWAELAASKKVADFGILWPAAVSQSVLGRGAVWNVGLASSIWSTPDDVGFLLRLVEMAPRIYHQVDASRIYLTGRGEGCQLALNFLDTPRPPGDIADSGSKLVSGVACMGAYGGRGGGASYSAVPVLMIHMGLPTRHSRTEASGISLRTRRRPTSSGGPTRISAPAVQSHAG